MDKLKAKEIERSLTKSSNVGVMGPHYATKEVPCCENTYKSNLKQDLSPKLFRSNTLRFRNKAVDKDYSSIIDDAEFKDNNHYDRYVPIKYTASQQLLELKLQSSLLQILQQEIPNVRNVPIECTDCKIPHCFDCSRNSSICNNKSLRSVIEIVKESSLQAIPKPVAAKLTRKAGLDHERGTKWESYMTYVKPRKCDCSKMSKKQLFEHLPAYLRKTSNYDAPELPNYETCPVTTLKTLVKKAKGQKETVPILTEVLSGAKEIATQYSNHELECLCSYIFNENIHQCFKEHQLKNEVDPRNVKNSLLDSSMSGAYLTKEITTFAKDRAISLRHFIEEAPEIKEIFEHNIED